MKNSKNSISTWTKTSRIWQKTTAQNVVLQQLLEDAIFDLEGLTVTDQDYLSYGTAAAPDKGYDSVDAWEKAEGKTP